MLFRSRNFRNEGISTQHNPEFTMLEFYQAYSNYHDLMDLTEELVKYVAMEVNGSLLTSFNGVEIDLGKWTKLSMREAIIKFWPPNAGVAPVVSTFADEKAVTSLLLEGIAVADQSSKNPQDNSTFQADLKLMAGFANVLAIFGAILRGDGDVIPAQHGQVPLGKAVAALFEQVAEPYLTQPTII